ncbi:MAG TPA: Cd(II)/Pb(II)-responsive transcriptional regulator [Azospira sp.]|nr:Cd(II)/Pb(II)-responsive transcriptional regulator [Azospira sp.]
MKIGELAAATGTPADTIRYYERAGLMPAPARSDGNYRVYTAAHAERLAFIRQCRSLDMSLAEIGTLLAFVDAPDGPCDAVNTVLDAHIGHVEQRIGELRRLERQLRTLRAACAVPGTAARCGILAGLAQGETSPPRPERADRHIGGAHAKPAATPRGKG